MTQPFVSTSLLLLCVAWITALFIISTARAGQVRAEAPETTRRWMVGVTVGVALWLALSAALALSGVLEDTARRLPPIALLVGTAGIISILIAFSPLGARLVAGISIAWLVGFQAFRILVEVMLASLYHAGQVPVQMTFEGLNFDIISGITALIVAWLAARHRLPRWTLLLWNCVGLALVLTIAVISALSVPGPTRVFANEPPNTIILSWPYIWLPVFLVQAAIVGHLLVFRYLGQRPDRVTR